MTRVLLTGGNGFLGSHILAALLSSGHSVVTTVRSEVKANAVRAMFPGTPSSRLDFAVVLEINSKGAFDEAVKADPPFGAVIHNASPFVFPVEDIRRDILEPAIRGTEELLYSVHKYAPEVKRVIYTSSTAAVMGKPMPADYVYTAEDWTPMTDEIAMSSDFMGYLASKTYAERTAWDFLAKEKPAFTLTTLCPPLIFGPVIHEHGFLVSVNTSNKQVADFLRGKCRDEIPENHPWHWVDVRDCALAHVRAMESDSLGGRRVLLGAGSFCNREIAAILRQNFPQLAAKLPGEDIAGGKYPDEGVPKLDVAESMETLGMSYRSLETCIVDLACSLLAGH